MLYLIELPIFCYFQRKFIKNMLINRNELSKKNILFQVWTRVTEEHVSLYDAKLEIVYFW